MPLDFSDPRVIKFVQENYELEKDQRIGWFLANKDQLVKQATFGKNYKGYTVNDILRAPLNICMPMLSNHHKVSRGNRRKKVASDGPILGLSWIKDKANMEPDIGDELRPQPVMKPVAEVERSILYEDLPLGGFRQYLNVRKRKIPEEKYYFCETSSNVIGWQWKDSAFPSRPPKYGRRNTLLNEASRSGPQPDPSHY